LLSDTGKLFLNLQQQPKTRDLTAFDRSNDGDNAADQKANASQDVKDQGENFVDNFHAASKTGDLPPDHAVIQPEPRPA
jgi:hypothetical protein